MPQLSSCRWLLLAGLAGAALASSAAAQRPSPPQPGVLRVCADPDNMPFSNDKGEGFENKLAELIAREWNSKLQYVWFPQRRGYFRVLNGLYCDLAIEAPSQLDMAATTKPYYRSGYVFVVRKGSGLEDLKSLDDPRLKKLTIGVNLYTSDAENSPPAMALSRHGVVGNLKGYGTFYGPDTRPEDIITAVAEKQVDLAIVWGPLAGYFAQRSPVPLVLIPLPPRDSLSGYPLQYDIAMGVRRRDRELRDSLQRVLDRKRPEIEAILKDYNVPVLPMPPDSDQRAGAALPPSDRAKGSRVR